MTELCLDASALVRHWVLAGAKPDEFMRKAYVIVPSNDFDDVTAAGKGNEYPSDALACEAVDRLNVEHPLDGDEEWVVDEVAWVKGLDGSWRRLPP